MTPDDMISNLQSMLGNIGTVLDTEILRELQLAQVQAERGPVLPWFLVTEATASTVASTPNIAVPDNFLREAEDDALYVVTSGGAYIPLEKSHLQDLREEHGGQDEGQPESYAIAGGQFWLYPIPDVVYTLRMFYYKKDPTTLAVAGAENLWSLHYPDLLMGLAGQNLVIHQKEYAEKARFDEMVLVARRQMDADNTARNMENFEGAYGGG